MLTLAETKLHLRVDHADEDSLITRLIDAATISTASYLDDPDLVLDNTAPAPIKAAALLMVGDLYANRELKMERMLYVNSAYQSLLQPYRKISV